jgi:hypothetical protein
MYKTNSHGFHLSETTNDSIDSSSEDDDAAALQQQQPPSQMHSGLFPLACRTNHSCSPNATFSFNPSLLSLELRALTTIDPGQEVTISYFPSTCLLLPRDDRRANIMRSRNFLCLCPLCLLPPAQSDAQDETRNYLLDVLEGAPDYPSAMDNPPSVTLPQIEDALVKLDSIGDFSARVLFCQKAFDMAAMNADEDATKLWARRTKQEWITRLGSDAEIVSELADVEEDPREHRKWAAKPRKGLRVPVDEGL